MSTPSPLEVMAVAKLAAQVAALQTSVVAANLSGKLDAVRMNVIEIVMLERLIAEIKKGPLPI